MTTSPYVNYEAVAAMSDQELASAYLNDSMPTDLFTAIENEVCARANISLDETEQGISYKARADMDAWAKAQ